jgi:hypothetical protein
VLKTRSWKVDVSFSVMSFMKQVNVNGFYGVFGYPDELGVGGGGVIALR